MEQQPEKNIDNMPIDEKIINTRQTLEELLVNPDEYIEKIRVTAIELEKLLEEYPDDEARKVLTEAKSFVESREQA